MSERVSECIFYLFNRFFICHLFLYFIILIFCCCRRRSSFGMFFISLARAIACGRRSGFADFLWLLLALWFMLPPQFMLSLLLWCCCCCCECFVRLGFFYVHHQFCWQVVIGRPSIYPSYLVLFTFSTVPYVKCMSLYLEVCAPTWASTFCVIINKVVFIH